MVLLPKAPNDPKVFPLLFVNDGCCCVGFPCKNEGAPPPVLNELNGLDPEADEKDPKPLVPVLLVPEEPKEPDPNPPPLFPVLLEPKELDPNPLDPNPPDVG